MANIESDDITKEELISFLPFYNKEFREFYFNVKNKDRFILYARFHLRQSLYLGIDFNDDKNFDECISGILKKYKKYEKKHV